MNIFWYDLKLSLVLKTKLRIYKELTKFYKFLFIKKYFLKMIYWGNYNHFLLQIAKKIIQKIIHMKKLFW